MQNFLRQNQSTSRAGPVVLAKPSQDRWEMAKFSVIILWKYMAEDNNQKLSELPYLSSKHRTTAKQPNSQ